MRSLMRAFGIGAVLLLLVGVDPGLIAGPARAASFTVDSTADGLDADTSDGICRTALNTCTLRAAIMQANASAGADTITLPAGTYVLTLSGTNEDSATLGDLDVTDAVTITGAGSATTIVDANKIDRVFDVRAGGSLSLSGVTVTRGEVVGPQGGGIRNAGALSLSSVVLSANAANTGGALHQVGSGGPTLTIVDSTIGPNSAHTGGGLNADGGTVTITGGAIEDNLGGGVTGGASLTMTGTTVTRNQHTGIVAGGPLSLTDVTFSQNVGANGGGLAVNGTSLATLQRVTFQNNTATTWGGGLSSGVTSRVQVVDSAFIGNQAERGGAVHGGAAFTNTTFSGNHATNEGGALFLTTGTVVGGAITGNTATVGAGVYLRHEPLSAGISTSCATPTLANVRVAQNDASVHGGGVVNGVLSPVALSQVTVEANTAGGNGGGIVALQGSDTMLVCRSTVNANTASQAGGGWVLGRLTLQNSTVSGNSAASGGGIAYEPPSSPSPSQPAPRLTLTNATVAANTATSGNGGGLLSTAGPFEVANSIVANGTGGNCAGVGFTSQGNNLSSDNSCPFNAAGDLKNENPLLGPLANNGGPTKTHALGAGSPAIDDGNNATCPSEDQRGEPRPRDGDGDAIAVCDIGAFEAATVAGTPRDVSLTKAGSAPSAVVGQPFTYTLTVTNNSAAGVTGVKVADTLPGGVAVNGTTTTNGSCDQAGSVVTCTVGPMDPGKSATITITITPSSVGTLHNTATATLDQADANTANNTATLDTPVTPPPGQCSPRPRVVVETANNGDGRLRVRIAATANPGQANEVKSIAWTTLNNAVIFGLGTVHQGQTTTLPPGTDAVTFFVGRNLSAQPTTVQVTVTDNCGAWPTVFGGGPGAF